MIKVNGNTVDIRKFPNGETFIDINKASIGDREAVVELKFESDQDLIALKFIKDFIDDIPDRNAPTRLIMGYVPYSRMDRREENRLFTLKTVANFINDMKFSSVEVWEPHSDVSVDMLDRVKVVNKSADLAYEAIMDELEVSGSAWLDDGEYAKSIGMGLVSLFKKAEDAGIWLVYPDAGAEKRYSKQIKYPHIMTATKHRDFNTGRITSIKVNVPDNIAEDHPECKTAIIVDDLCSKGGTFVGTAKELEKLGFTNIVLCVTHCENTVFDGDVFKSGLFSKVYTTNSILTGYMPGNDYTIDNNELCVR